MFRNFRVQNLPINPRFLSNRALYLPLMKRIFASHSRRDTDIVHFFSAAFATSKKGVKSDFMEFEDLEGKYAGREIAKKITSKETQAVFVL